MLSVEHSQAPARTNSLGADAAARWHPESPSALVREVTIERAKVALAVAHRVEDAEAEQMLLETAADAGLPVTVAAEDIMARLWANTSDGTTTTDVVERALAAVRDHRRAAPPDVSSARRPHSTARAA